MELILINKIIAFCVMWLFTWCQDLLMHRSLDGALRYYNMLSAIRTISV